MKKTITVNIGGFSFVIDETAYDDLQNYLQNIEQKLGGDTAEIMQDIEWRIAELLKEKLAEHREVVDKFDIIYVQSVMGEPADFEDEQATADQGTKTADAETNDQKGLFRDMDNAMLGGVCSGLAQYFGVDPIVIRIVFVLFAIFGGSGLLLYIILLILIPSAKTTAEKLRMSGEAVNLESIQSHFNKVGSDLNEKIKSPKFSRKVNSAANKTVTAISTIFSVFGKIIGAVFTVAGIVCLISLFLYLIGSNTVLPFSSAVVADSLYDFLLVITPSPLFAKMLLISGVFVVVIPVTSIIYTGLKLLFGIKTSVPKSVSVSASVVFAVALILFVSALVRTGFSFGENAESVHQLELADTETVVVNILPENRNIFKTNSAYGCCDFMVVGKDSIALKNIELYVKTVADSLGFSIKTMFHSQGITSGNAFDLAERIHFNLSLENNVLKIPQHSTIASKDKFRAQRIKIVIEVPEGKQLKFKGDIEDLHHYNKNDEFFKKKALGENKTFVWSSAKDGPMSFRIGFNIP